MYNMISRFHLKPADLDLHCFQKQEYNFDKVKYNVHIRTKTVND